MSAYVHTVLSESVTLDPGVTRAVCTVPGGTAITVYVDARGLAGVAGSLLRLWGWCGDVRARIGDDVPIPVGAAQKLVSQRGWGVEKWDVEIVGGSAHVEGLRVVTSVYGREP